MKLISSHRTAQFALLASGLIALSAGCSKQERADAGAKTKEVVADTRDKAKEMLVDAKDKAKEVYADSKAAMTKAWDSVKTYSFEKRAEFTSTGKALAAEMEAKASKLRADYSDAKASASRKAAMAELKNSEADYKQKLDALGTATANTWDSAKNNAIASWDRLEAALRNAGKE